ncbi:hypothetical protein Nmel_003992 [Mimus melanotis]
MSLPTSSHRLVIEPSLTLETEKWVFASLSFRTLSENSNFKGEDVIVGSERLCLPNTSANEERKRTTCGWEFIKQGCTSKTSRENPAGMCPSGLPPFIQIKLQDSCLLYGHWLFIAELFRSHDSTSGILPLSGSSTWGGAGGASPSF